MVFSLSDAAFVESVDEAALEQLRSRARAAKQRAVSAILARVEDDALPLDAIEDLTLKYERQRDAANASLRVLVEQRAAAAARSTTQLSAANAAATRIDAELHRMRGVSAEAKEALALFPRAQLDEAHTALRNLRSLLSLVDFYSSIPERCATLRADLQRDAGRLKDVYKKAMELEIWRSALQREVLIAGNQTRMRDGELQKRGAARAPAGAPQGVVYDAAELGALAKILGSHFAAVSLLVHDVFERVHAVLDIELLPLAADEPQRVVAAAEVVEMHDVLQRRLVSDARADAARFGDDADDAEERLRATVVGAAARQDALRRVYDGARRTAASEFATMQMRLVDDGHSAVSAQLGAATRLVVGLNAARRDAANCVPPGWCLLRLVRVAYEDHVHRQLSPLWDGADKRGELDVAELMQVAEWLDYYNTLVAEVDAAPEDGGEAEAFYDASGGPAPLLPCGPAARFERGAARLRDEYLDRIVSQVGVWFETIRAKPATLRPLEDGRLTTTRPEDMFQIVNVQIAVAREHAARAALASTAADAAGAASQGQHVATVVLRCLEELRADAQRSAERVDACAYAVDVYMSSGSGAARLDVRAPSLDAVAVDDDADGAPDASPAADVSENAPPNLEVEVLCSIANDALRVQERCEELLEALGRPFQASPALDAPSLRALEAVTQDIVADYGELAVRACAAAAAAPFVDLRDAVFAEYGDSALFSEAWQGEAAAPMQVALGTLDDYFADLRSWLPEMLFAKLAREAFERLVRCYVEALLRSRVEILDADHFAQLLFRDQNQILEHFFPLFAQDPALAAAGLRDAAALAGRLAVLRDLATVITCTPPDVPRDAVEALVKDFGPDAADAALALFQRHPLCAQSRALAAATKAAIVEIAGDLADEQRNAPPRGAERFCMPGKVSNAVKRRPSLFRSPPAANLNNG
ncbi:exocyst complex component Sec6-domain-containing protein [Pelagophyceae sp. CCMP2097]|nr:exocyst complex component Sec6-domain-containing protein [Pelagophyceae sp. CCMP2097]